MGDNYSMQNYKFIFRLPKYKLYLHRYYIMKRLVYYIFLCFILLEIAACSSTKLVPDGQYLLDKVKIYTDRKEINAADLKPFIRQNPNAKWFSLLKVPLYIYDFSGRDSTKWMNKLFRKIGSPPVIYDEITAKQSQNELMMAVRNMGYMGAVVEQTNKIKKKKLTLVFQVKSGSPYILHKFTYDVSDTKILNCLYKDSVSMLIHPGSIFNINSIDAERERISTLLNNNGYYKFNKEYIRYTADTVYATHQVDLTMHLIPLKGTDKYRPAPYRQYYIKNVKFVSDFDLMQTPTVNIDNIDSLSYNGYSIFYKDYLRLRPKVLTSNVYFAPGDIYNGQNVRRTYTRFGKFSALKYSNIRFIEQADDSTALNSYILLTPGKSQSIAFEVEGTNSAGDLGAATSLTYQHRNIFHGSETFMVKLRGAYEAISGLEGYSSNGYTEYGVETSLNFPRFVFPFLSNDFRKRISASSEFGLRYNYQLRPEFSRTVLSTSWSYRWAKHQKAQHRIDLLDISYIYLPWISDTFKENYIDKGQNYIFEYNYSSRFIFRTGYSFIYNSLGVPGINNTVASNSYTLRLNFESAGNLLYVISKAFNMQRNSKGQYSIFNIPYAQYLKGDIDYVRSFTIDRRNSLLFHSGFGIAVPYANAKTVPFEKQYFSGGANSVRGWSVRDLGPGRFPGDGNYLDQSGDIKFDANVELRSRLFWKLRGAAFVDAGNIWSIRNYENQPGGVFKLNEFYKQIAVAYGLGLRFDFDFFVLRFDFGMKALNPVYSSGIDRYPLLHPVLSRDLAIHFAVGYPF